MVHVQAIMEAPFGNAHECLWQGLRFAVVSPVAVVSFSVFVFLFLRSVLVPVLGGFVFPHFRVWRWFEWFRSSRGCFVFSAFWLS